MILFFMMFINFIGNLKFIKTIMILDLLLVIIKQLLIIQVIYIIVITNIKVIIVDNLFFLKYFHQIN
jgi:hypothetical protein